MQHKKSKSQQSKCLIAFGSNESHCISTAKNTVTESLDALSRNRLFEINISGFYKTSAFPTGSGPDFVNGVVKAKTDLSAAELLAVLHELEADMGRERSRRWEARSLDLDLIDFAGCVVPNQEVHKEWRQMPLEKQMRCAPEQMILPHPRVQDRPFVLVPLHDVAPDWVHPVTGVSVSDMLAEFSEFELAKIRPLE
jgi:2-amino-4-hydroxy-6-hydroxymethyldihydropteridine diphosphokinase